MKKLKGLQNFYLVRRMLLCTVVALLHGSLLAQQDDDIAIIPKPVAAYKTTGAFLISNTLVYCADSSLYPSVALLNLYLSAMHATPLISAPVRPSANYIELMVDSNTVTQAEGYHLSINKNNIKLQAHDAAGIVYGIQTLRQLLKQHNNSITVPCYTIEDYPRFSYRGMALDVSRHMFPVTFIKKYIDLLSLYKFNTFHWHLTDDQGWRIEIKNYPLLQSVAAWRDETLIGHKKELPHRFDGKRYGGYYTQQEVQDVIQYAQQRNITIIPEIEMPGHALAALSAYPSLGCTGGPYKAAAFWGVFDDVYCAGNDSTFIFLENVLDEVMELFPSKYIHIGGDECPKTKWQHCPKCQQRIKLLGLKDENDLQSYFVTRIEKYINSKGRNIIGWDEILEGGPAPNATVMSWRGEAGGIAAAKLHHNVVMTPESHLYFDYYQSLYKEEPLAAGGYTPLEKVYSYDPQVTDTTVTKYIKGVEGQAWSEYFTDTVKAEYMIFPRAVALAEIGWSPSSLRSYSSFLERIRAQSLLLKQLKVNADLNLDDISYHSVTTTQQSLKISLQSNARDATIYYTIDGSAPGIHSIHYILPFVLNKSSTVKAIAIDKKVSTVKRIFQQSFIVHKALGAKVELANKPVANFNTDTDALVNGIYATARYNDRQWIGFRDNDLEAVIDMNKVQSLHSLQMSFLNYHWQRMWAPQKLDIFISSDKIHYQKIYSQQNFTVNGINKVFVKLKAVKARYIKLSALNKGVIPAGEYGAGGNALLMVDEVEVQ